MEDALVEHLKYPHYRHMLLKESRIEPAVVEERGYYTAKTKTELASLGFPERQRRAPALVIPMYSPAGGLVTRQIRPDALREDGEGKAVKYGTPAGFPVRLDVHPSQAGRVKDVAVPL